MHKSDKISSKIILINCKITMWRQNWLSVIGAPRMKTSQHSKAQKFSIQNTWPRHYRLIPLNQVSADGREDPPPWLSSSHFWKHDDFYESFWISRLWVNHPGIDHAFWCQYLLGKNLQELTEQHSFRLSTSFIRKVAMSLNIRKSSQPERVFYHT